MTDNSSDKSRQSSSDAISATVGENAQNVIVGKDVNFIQIAGIRITKWLARLLLFTLVMGTVSLIAYTLNAVMTLLPPPVQAIPATATVTSIPAVVPTPTATLIPSAICPRPASHDPLQNFDEMVSHVPSTTFSMGDEELGLLKHTISAQDFWIDTYEVTNFQYKRFVDDTGHVPPPSWKMGAYESDRAFDPVAEVTWEDAGAYCKWRGKRLPTEAEWELSCRGENSRKFPWGDVWRPEYANVMFSGCNDAVAVGSFSPQGNSVFSVTDLIGNVSEWVSSAYKDYPYLPENEEKNNPSVSRVIRGGDFGSLNDLARCAARQFAPPSTAVVWVGFRCVRDN